MTGIDAGWILGAARRLERRRGAARLALALTTGSLGAAIAWRAGAGTAAIAAAGLAAASAALIASRALLRRRPVTPERLAGHLDRVIPAAEESSVLLLAEEDGLPLLARLQRRRTVLALGRLEARPRLPDGPARRLLQAAGAAATAALLAALLPAPAAGGGRNAPAGSRPGAAGGTPAAAGLRLAELTIRPPAYTGRPVRRQAGWEAEAEEGATVEWRFTVSGPAAGGRLLTSAGDSVPLTAAGGAGYAASLTARRSTLYRVVLADPGGAVTGSEDHRLGVRLDAPPVLAVVRPAPRTVLRAGEPWTVPVEVLARDDYGVDSAALVATITRGQGEGVRFREEQLGFEGRTRLPDGTMRLTRTLDLARLGMEPGDELYFHVAATDRRTPVPNRARSETVFLSIADTARADGVAPAGVALDLPPDFFRSQRQLIIDTEQLLKDRSRLPAAVFRDRSNGLGIDQGLLRLRYGQFMGDEFEGGSPGSGREAHGRDAEPPKPADPDAPPPDARAELTHDHDAAENATLLAAEIKAKLREAINHMWQSELHLRTTDPKASLPFQYRALVLLQEIRQDARAYVQRVGFEPPPLEPDRKRLTGDLSAITRPLTDRVAAGVEALPAVRRGLEVLQRLRAGGAPEAGDRAALEAAGAELAPRAADDPARLLEPLRALRRVIASLAPGSAPCPGCREAAEQGLWLALPPARPGASGTGSPAGSLTREYLRRLGARP